MALALQGGGVHGAYTWGVLDRLLEDGLAVGRVCGVSSGALIAAMLVQGLVKDGAAGARQEMRRLWERVSQANSLNPLQSGPLESWLWGWDVSSDLVWQGVETALRMFSPAQLNPFGHNPLRAVIADVLDRDALTHASAIPLTVAATDVETGASVRWTNAQITVDVLLASCCLPFVFHAVEIDGRAYWDGGYSGNPPLGPLLLPRPPAELVLIRAQPAHRPGAPGTPAEILNRLNEIACHGVLEAELAALPGRVRVSAYDADKVLAELPLSSKFNANPAFLTELFEAGRAAALLAPQAAAK
ncbi:patatin-like phospholipase family protein [Rhodovastum sp. RN2-1]|uniref:Patatin-like phospholipase family protein n=1 Tax=Limobrevibacterium gyesilva TaxID=2991712 RepID=A0AA41YMP0_9PROT|nr:patatin-like phospholipase family protein [Limobrevibacterium gyesilva]